MKFIHVLAAASVALLAGCAQKSSTVNYYFDAENGNDTNTGTSADAPFRTLAKAAELDIKPGDSLLLRAGSVFTDSLLINKSGSAEAPVVYAKYGGEGRPHIKGGGDMIAPVRLLNAENIVIRDLEVSNRGAEPRPRLAGVLLELDNYGDARNVTVENLYIHDVLGLTEISDGGGIAIAVHNAHEADTTLSRFDGLLIADCLIKDCQRDGIRISGYWERHRWNPNLNVVVRGNTLDGVPGDGIMIGGCDGALVEYNTMRNCPRSLKESEACDGIWPWCSDNTVVQFNVVSDHKSRIDGYAYDSDWGCRNSVFQYNLSYNNDGGFMLVIGTDGWPEGWCVNGNKDTQVRYNVSINDGLRNYYCESLRVGDHYFSPVMNYTGYTQNTVLENNIFVCLPKPEPLIDRTLFHFTKHDDAYGKGDIFRNNYISATEPTVAVIEEQAVGNVYEGNMYVGPLSGPAGFERVDGPFGKNLWYDSSDPNWDILLDFLKDKTVPVDGREVSVLELIGANN